jgi:hypothetical protein
MTERQVGGNRAAVESGWSGLAIASLIPCSIPREHIDYLLILKFF